MALSLYQQSLWVRSIAMTTRIGAPQAGQHKATRGGGETDPYRFGLAGLSLHDHEADGREQDGIAGMENQ